jgi:Flp pilus assembly protein TadG
MAAVKRWLKNRKRAAAAVELAIVTPILLTMLFGIIEYGWLFTARQAIVTAAREGARTAALPGSTVTDVQTRVNNFMTPLGLDGYTTNVQVDGQNPTGEVTVAIPYANVSLLGGYFGNPTGTVTSTCSMKKEGVD